ncbi:hypothetical protein F8388_016278 [Cannabis sativa]|uniref:Ankyrin repeat-containing protein n=1 Tax=Cannabis sativa TaxID=3483 RepID=A0A7J6DVS7_CANSA|nr:hypothetical protein F8388_016278 [Cannabis sativa]
MSGIRPMLIGSSPQNPSKKDASSTALIQSSCGRYALSLLNAITRANKLVWTTIKGKYVEEVNSTTQNQNEEEITEQFIQQEDHSTTAVENDIHPVHVISTHHDVHNKYRPFFNDVINGNLKEVRDFIIKEKENNNNNNNNNAIMKVTLPGSGKNALHVAISGGQLQIVQVLVKNMSDEEIYMKRKDDLTVLHAAVEIGNIEIAECLVSRQKGLLTFCSKIVKVERHPRKQSAKHRRHHIGLDLMKGQPSLGFIKDDVDRNAIYIYMYHQLQD